MLVHQGEGSGTPTEHHHTPSPEDQTPSHSTYPSSSLPPVTTTSIPTVTSTETTSIRQYTRRTKIAQSSIPPTIRTGQPLITTLPHDSAPWVTSPAAVERSMQQTIPELTTLCTSLQRQLSELTAKFQAQEVEINRLKEIVKQLEEREGVAAINSGDDAPIKGRSMDEGEAATERVSDDTKEMATVLTSMDAATVLASGVVDVPAGSGSIPTASTLAEGSVPTGSEEDKAGVIRDRSEDDAPIKGRSMDEREAAIGSVSYETEEMAILLTSMMQQQDLEEKLTREDQRRAEQIDRDAEIARIHVEEELQSMIDGLDSNNETLAKYLEEYQQESAKKQKSSKEITEEAKSHKEVFKEKIKEMMQLVPIEEVYVEALQVKHPIIDWE
nr:hypothetical protein [Tanacetum cinerariifolium]